jgi:hypothetical protein
MVSASSQVRRLVQSMERDGVMQNEVIKEQVMSPSHPT